MTPLQHNKRLGILHLIYAGLATLLIIVFVIFLFGMLGIMAATEPSRNNEDFPPILFAMMMIVVMGFNFCLVAPSFVAGYGFLKRKPWAKNIGLIAGIVSGLNFPIGSALCVYTIWFLFGENGRHLYDKPADALPPGPPLWTRAKSREQERVYVPPSTPPDWR